MNFDLNEDQQMLKALAERFVTDRYYLTRRSSYQQNETGYCAKNWDALAEIGLFSAAFSETSGGLGFGPVEILILSEALGYGLVVEPLIDATVLAGPIFEEGAGDDLAAKWLPNLISGKKRLGLAYLERGARGNLDWVEMQAEEDGDTAYLSGEKIAVAHAVGADGFVVSAKDADGALQLYLAEAGSSGLSLAPYRHIDGSVAARLKFNRVAAQRLDGGLAALESGVARASLAHMGEALGVMCNLFEATLKFLRERHQFGKTLGSFQAIQHRMVIQYVALEQSRALLTLAAMTDMSDREEWLRMIAGARAFISDAAVSLGHEAIQMHGGMGMSDEVTVGRAHRRLVLLSRMPFSAEVALDHFAGNAS